MSDPTMVSAEEAKKPCRVCAEPILSGAHKCIHCGSYQDWLKNLSISSTVLALIATLISVIGQTLPVLVNTFSQHNSNLVAVFEDADDTDIHVVISNIGTRPGAMRYATLTVGTNFPKSESSPSGNKFIRLNIDRNNAPSNNLIQPNTPTPIDLASSQQFDPAWLYKRPGLEYDGLECRLTFAYANFDGSRTETNSDILCAEIDVFLVKHTNLLLPDK